jgi:hypothetical protein
MHGLQQIVQMNKEQEEFIEHILNQPRPEINLLRVWQDWKEESNQKQREIKDNEPVSLHTD